MASPSQTASQLPREWFEPSDAYGWVVLVRNLIPLFAALAALPFVTTARHLIWLPIVVVVLGVATYRLTIVIHECCHSSLFGSAKLNRRVGEWLGALVGVEFSSFQSQHMAHHRFNGGDEDPNHAEAWGLEGKRRGFVVWHLLKPLLGVRLFDVYNYYLKPSNKRAEPSSDQKPARAIPFGLLFRVALVQSVAALVATGFGRRPLLIFVFPLTAVTIALFLSRVRTFAEHVQFRSSARTDFTRSHPTRLIDSIFLYEAHFNFHKEHHLYPSAPAYKLPAIHHKLKETIHTPDSLGTSMLRTVYERIREASQG